MPHLMLTWETAAAGAFFLVAVGWAGLAYGRGRVTLAVAPFVREAGVVLALYALWQLAGGLSLDQAGDAVSRGQWIWKTERAWHLPSEASAQHGIIHHGAIVQACNIYYAVMHFGMLIAALLWLYGRHREAYARVRTTLVLTTTACLLVALVPVAPPRLLHVGMIDTARAYGQSVYTSAIGADQYSAMPSVHVAWAGLVAIAVVTVSTSRWRWLILLHFVATVYVVIVTANHFWADGIVALALLGLAMGLQTLTRWAVRRVRVRRLTTVAPLDLDAGDDLSVR